MKKFSVLMVLLFLILGIYGGRTTPPLFDIDKELDSFKKSEVTEEEKEKYNDMEFYLITGGPGSLVWENFGHSAILFTSPDSFPIAYDWGIFTFDDSFFVNFAFGRLYYEAWATYGEYRIESLISDDRSVTALKLELDENQKKNLLSFLMYSTKEENKTYLYDYFRDNCATRPRDIYSWLTDGEFEEKLKSTPSEETLRETVERHLSLSTFPVAWTISYLLGPDTDKEETKWEACFLPSTLNECIKDYQECEDEIIYSSFGRKPVPEKWSLKIRSFLMGLALIAISLLPITRKRWIERCSDIILGIIYLFFGVLSLVLLFFMLFTIHNVTKGNINCLIISPLCLISSFLHFASLSKKRKNKALLFNLGAMLVLALILLTLRLIIPSFIQDSYAVFIPAIMLYASEVFASYKSMKNK